MEATATDRADPDLITRNSSEMPVRGSRQVRCASSSPSSTLMGASSPSFIPVVGTVRRRPIRLDRLVREQTVDGAGNHDYRRPALRDRPGGAFNAVLFDAVPRPPAG